ncbi:hypothetical protein [Sphingomicrobium marinum]|uniref:hypothetical protein n=1 Tax=Sphingomicrobium marinum TaxID=1227950 RepID=UPI00223EAF5E|nr:hypothetical protein [Sphingomicrobium marinum]
MMFSIIFALAATPEIEGADDRQACLAWLSNQPPYASQSIDEITVNDAFFDKAGGTYCSNATMPLYTFGHELAAKEMAHLERNGIIPGKQDRVEEIVIERLRADWTQIAPRRAEQLTLSDEARRDLMIAYMLDEDADKGLTNEQDIAVFTCVGKAVRLASDQRTAMEADHETCGLPSLRAGIINGLEQRFPGASNEEIAGMVDGMIRMGVTYAAIAEGEAE